MTYLAGQKLIKKPKFVKLIKLAEHFFEVKIISQKAADHLTEYTSYDPKCRWSNCFDIFNCTELTIYLYPLQTRSINGKSVTPQMTKEWHRIYKELCDFFPKILI